MIYSGETNEQDLVGDCKWWCGIDYADTTTYPIKDITRNANLGLDKAVSLIMRADTRWKWDDINNTDLPIATTSLVSGQEDYPIAVTHLKIIKVRIKDSAGNWVSLDPTDRRDLSDYQLTATAGDPKRYSKIGNSIFLNPKPSYASSGGLEVQFQRGANYFAYDDTTKTPGFASQFHGLVSLYAALPYCEVNDLEKRAMKIRARIQEMEASLVDFYSSRDADTKINFSIRRENYGEDNAYSNNPKAF